MVIMIAGPYRSGSLDPLIWEENLQFLNRMAFEVFQKGHTPIVGVNLVLPIIQTVGMDKYDDIMMPICLRIADKCDAVLRIGGTSAGADLEVDVFKAKQLPIYSSMNKIPSISK